MIDFRKVIWWKEKKCHLLKQPDDINEQMCMTTTVSTVVIMKWIGHPKMVSPIIQNMLWINDV